MYKECSLARSRGSPLTCRRDSGHGLGLFLHVNQKELDNNLKRQLINMNVRKYNLSLRWMPIQGHKIMWWK